MHAGLWSAVCCAGTIIRPVLALRFGFYTKNKDFMVFGVSNADWKRIVAA